MLHTPAHKQRAQPDGNRTFVYSTPPKLQHADLYLGNKDSKLWVVEYVDRDNHESFIDIYAPTWDEARALLDRYDSQATVTWASDINDKGWN